MTAHAEVVIGAPDCDVWGYGGEGAGGTARVRIGILLGNAVGYVLIQRGWLYGNE